MAQGNPTPELRNETGLEFGDISSEAWREYRFPGGDTIRIDNPRNLHVAKSGGHRIFDTQGECHYIPKGWIHLRWKARSGQPHFVR